MSRLVKLIICFFKLGKILGIFRFSYNKKTKCFEKSRFSEIYSGIVWTIVLFYIPYFFFISIDSYLSLAGSDKNGILLLKINFFSSYFIFHLLELTTFWCLFFGRPNLLKLANEGINLYRSVTSFKKYPRPSADRFFWLLLIRIIRVGISVFLSAVIFYNKKNWSYSNIFKNFITFYMSTSCTCCLDLKNIVFFVAAHLLKLLKLELLTLNRNFKNDSKLRANELRRITKQYQKILNFLQKVDELLNINMLIILLYFFGQLTSMVTNIFHEIP
jgi:hypothetical protein